MYFGGLVFRFLSLTDDYPNEDLHTGSFCLVWV